MAERRAMQHGGAAPGDVDDQTDGSFCGVCAVPPNRMSVSLLDQRWRSLPAWITLVFGLGVVTSWDAVRADNFANVYYDPRNDQLFVTVFYRGTNPDHTFSLKWGQCRESQNGGAREIVAEVLDSQWNDAASRDFKKTTKFDLESLQCRPAKVTLRTAPRFYYTLQIPARAVTAP